MTNSFLTRRQSETPELVEQQQYNRRHVHNEPLHCRFMSKLEKVKNLESESGKNS